MVDALNEANFIWQEYIAAQIDENDIDRLNLFYEYMVEHHNDFSDDFSIILYTMVYGRSYNKKTFKLYMKKNITNNNLNNILKHIFMFYNDSYIEDQDLKTKRFHKIIKKYYNNLYKDNQLLFKYIIELGLYNYKSTELYNNHNFIKNNTANSKDETLITAKFIHNLYKSYKGNITEPYLNKVHDFLLKHHKTFCSSYPIVVKYMIYMNQYSEKAFDRFLLHWKNNVPNDRNDYYKIWAKYPHNLYRYGGLSKKSRYDPKIGKKIEEDAYDKLIEEYNDWQNAIEEAEQKFDKQQEESMKRKRNEIKKFILTKKQNTNNDNIDN